LLSPYYLGVRYKLSIRPPLVGRAVQP
jgi:hypothetical protein